MADFDHIDPSRRHWYREDHFASQLGSPAARAVVEGRWQVFTREIRRWLDSYKLGTGGRTLDILDAGCGDGINLVGLDRIFRDLGQPIALAGIDYNEVRIERARQLGVTSDVRVGSLLATDLATASVDFILLNHVLEHIPDKRPVLVELRRILRPGGLLIVGVPNEGCALARLRNHVLQPSVLRTTDHVHFFTASSLRRDLDDAGFTVGQVLGEGFFVPHLRLQTAIGTSAGGRRVLGGLRRVLPSQAAGLIALARAVPGRGGQ